MDIDICPQKRETFCAWLPKWKLQQKTKSVQKQQIPLNYIFK